MIRKAMVLTPLLVGLLAGCEVSNEAGNLSETTVAAPSEKNVDTQSCANIGLVPLLAEYRSLTKYSLLKVKIVTLSEAINVTDYYPEDQVSHTYTVTPVFFENAEQVFGPANDKSLTEAWVRGGTVDSVTEVAAPVPGISVGAEAYIMVRPAPYAAGYEITNSYAVTTTGEIFLDGDCQKAGNLPVKEFKGELPAFNGRSKLPKLSGGVTVTATDFLKAARNP